tara:strand:- start:1609 stop:2106 length:498 start_codon:yes stop_codon:yes gene_type:complete
MPIKIQYKDMPHIKPVPMATKEKGFFGGIVLWLVTTRKFELTADWKYSLTVDGNKTAVNYIVPRGFVFDGASVPKYFRSWLSPMGVLLIGGLVHDYGYKYETLLLAGGKKVISKKNQKWMDKTFRDINIDVNGFKVINYIAYYALRLGGFMAWRGHRKRNIKWDD